MCALTKMKHTHDHYNDNNCNNYRLKADTILMKKLSANTQHTLHNRNKDRQGTRHIPAWEL